MLNFIPMKKAGSLRTGRQGDRGSIIHAVPKPDGRFPYEDPALCGQSPAVQWSDCTGFEVNCPRCLRRIAA